MARSRIVPAGGDSGDARDAPASDSLGYRLTLVVLIVAARCIASAVMIAAPPILVIWLCYGHPLPQSVLAKSQATGSALGEILRVPEPVSAVLTLLGLARIVACLREGGPARMLCLWVGTHWQRIY